MYLENTDSNQFTVLELIKVLCNVFSISFYSQTPIDPKIDF